MAEDGGNDLGYLTAKLEFLGDKMDEIRRVQQGFEDRQTRFETRVDERLKALEKPLSEASVGFRFVRWIGLLLVALAALKNGDTSLLKSLF